MEPVSTGSSFKLAFVSLRTFVSIMECYCEKCPVRFAALNFQALDNSLWQGCGPGKNNKASKLVSSALSSCLLNLPQDFLTAFSFLSPRGQVWQKVWSHYHWSSSPVAGLASMFLWGILWCLYYTNVIFPHCWKYFSREGSNPTQAGIYLWTFVIYPCRPWWELGSLSRDTASLTIIHFGGQWGQFSVCGMDPRPRALQLQTLWKLDGQLTPWRKFKDERASLTLQSWSIVAAPWIKRCCYHEVLFCRWV